jgi:hypothetical protein
MGRPGILFHIAAGQERSTAQRGTTAKGRILFQRERQEGLGFLAYVCMESLKVRHVSYPSEFK